jgi:hypothetical protein
MSKLQVVKKNKNFTNGMFEDTVSTILWRIRIKKMAGINVSVGIKLGQK